MSTDEVNDGHLLAYNIKAGAATLGISQSNLRTLVRQGILPAARVKGRILLPREALIDFLRKVTSYEGDRVREIPEHIRKKMKNSKGRENA